MNKQGEEVREVNINVQSPGEHIIRFGDAMPQKPFKALNLTGMLSAPADFLSKKTANYEKEEAHLIIDKDAMRLSLVLDEMHPHSTDTIVGMLSDDVELGKWMINTSHRWTVPMLLQFIRERKYFFADPAEQVKLIASLQKWNVNIQREIKKHNDNSGNSLDSLETTVSQVEGLIKKFNLHIPVFKGYPKEKFTVEIGLDPKSSQVDLYLYSDELFTVRRELLDRIFEAELKKFDALKFDCSRVNIS